MIESRQRNSKRALRRTYLFTMATAWFQGVSLGYSMIHYVITLSLTWSFARYVAALVTLMCYALWFIARVQLGNALAFFPKTSGPLVTRGLYSRLRNPIYIFGTGAMIGYICLLGNYWYFLLLIVVLPVQVIRSVAEHSVLKKKFGDDYVEYSKQCII